MVYTPTTWVAGDVITAALLNNLEAQYNNSFTDSYYVRYSTASTGTELLSLGSTYSPGGYDPTFIAYVVVPERVMQSRLELSADIKVIGESSLGANCELYRSNGFETNAELLDTTPFASVNSGTIAYLTKTTGFSIRGGDRFVIMGRYLGGHTSYITNIKISGTTTTVSSFDSSFLPYSTDRYTGVGTSTGG